ncbi:MAG: hypothetical protein HYU36_10250 [Planctomycetes bacterium]|nr:hypothetical protein [Planctomycetota bacterium]
MFPLFQQCSRSSLVRTALVSLPLLGLIQPSWSQAQDGPSGILHAFATRLTQTEERLPIILRAAELAARRFLEHEDAFINVPYAVQMSFAEEIVNRAGGLANALPAEERPGHASAHDIALLSVRAWNVDGPAILELAKEYRRRGWMVILFASESGRPDGLEIAFLVDNGARSGAAAHAPVNALINVLHAHLWASEFAAALTRRDRFPGVLLSVAVAGSDEHNRKVRANPGTRFLGECGTRMPPGTAARVYLEQVRRLADSLAGERTQQQVQAAADLVRSTLDSGKRVKVSSCTHFLMSEIFQNRLTPLEPFPIVWQSSNTARHLGRDDLMIWFGYVGMSTIYEDYGGALRRTGAKLVASYVPDQNRANNAADAACLIEQTWEPPDAVVPIPFPPDCMSPVSGLNVGLLYRMLEEKILELLGNRSAE